LRFFIDLLDFRVVVASREQKAPASPFLAPIHAMSGPPFIILARGHAQVVCDHAQDGTPAKIAIDVPGALMIWVAVERLSDPCANYRVLVDSSMIAAERWITACSQLSNTERFDRKTNSSESS
jgi:hypothetical protein